MAPSTGFDQSIADTAMKNVFESKGTVSQMQDAAPYSKSRTMKSKKYGLGRIASIQLQHNEAQGNRNFGGIDNEDLPEVSNPLYQKPQFTMVRTYKTLYASGAAVQNALSGDSLVSFLGDIGDLVTDATLPYYRDLDFRAFNTSTATGNKKACRGILDNTGYQDGATTFTLDVATSATHRRYKLLQGIRPGMKLDVYDSTAWTKAGEFLVVTTSKTTPVFTGTYSGAALTATASKYYLFRKGDFNRDIDGTGDIIDDGTYTTSYATLASTGLWQGNILSNSGTLRDFSPDLMDTAYLTMQKEAGENKKIEAWMTYGMKKELLSYVQRTIQLQKQTGNDTPFKANVGGDIEQWGPNFSLKISSLMAAHEIHFIQPDMIDFDEEIPFGPLSLGKNRGKDTFWQRIPGKDNWEAALVHKFQQRTMRRSFGLKLMDLNQQAF